MYESWRIGMGLGIGIRLVWWDFLANWWSRVPTTDQGLKMAICDGAAEQLY